MLSPLLYWLCSILAARPRTVQCPPGTYLNGSPASGISDCIDVSPDRFHNDDCTRGKPCGPWPPMPRHPVRVWCREDEEAVVVGVGKMGCKRV